MLPMMTWLPAQAPEGTLEATQDVALVVDQVSVEGCPTGTLVGASDRLTVGIGVGATVATTDALLATPSQVRV